MKVPKYILKLLEKRAKAAEQFIDTDIELVKWLDKNHIEISQDDILTGAVSLCEPRVSMRHVIQAIEEKE